MSKSKVEDCPIGPGLTVPRGWFASREIEAVLDKPTQLGSSWTARVRYTSGEEAVIKCVVGPMRYNGLDRFKVEEISHR